jgi:phage shock protein C
MPMNDRLYRSRVDRVVGGVCAGLGDRLDIDPSLVRVVWVIGTILTGFVFGILLYIILLIVVPEAPDGWVPTRGHYPPYPPTPYPPTPPQPGAVPGWTPPDPTSGAVGASGGMAPGAGAASAGMTTGEPPASGGTGAAPSDAAGWTAPAGQGGSWTPPPDAATGWTPPPGDAWTSVDPAYAARRAERRARRERNGRTVGLVFGALLILAGIWILLEEYLPDVDLGGFWPLVIVILGVIVLARAFTAPRDGGANGGGTAGA